MNSINLKKNIEQIKKKLKELSIERNYKVFFPKKENQRTLSQIDADISDLNRKLWFMQWELEKILLQERIEEIFKHFKPLFTELPKDKPMKWKRGRGVPKLVEPYKCSQCGLTVNTDPCSNCGHPKE